LAYIPTVLYPSDIPADTGSVLYTVPAATKVIVKNIVMTNTTGNEAQIHLNVVSSGDSPQASNRILSNYSVPANGVSTLDCSIVMEAGDTLQATNVTAGAVVVTISGVEIA